MKLNFIKVLTILTIAVFMVSCAEQSGVPVALDDNATLSSDNNFTIDVLKNDYDDDNDISGILIVNKPKYGEIVVVNGKIKYFPKKKQCGEDSFSYKAVDDLCQYSNEAKVNISFCINKGGSKNHAPVAKSDTLTIKENSTQDIKLKATDKDGDNLKYIIVTKPKHGKLSSKAPNLIYTPDKNYIGEDSFTFKANDGKVDSNIATITIKITDKNLPPIADAGKDYIGIKGDVVKFDGSKSRDLDGNITKYIWKEGNKTISTKVKFEMKFMKIGVHKITLTVIDDKNATDSDEKIVTIKPCCKGCVYPDPTATKPFK